MQQVRYTIAGRPLEVIGADDKPVKRRARVADILALASKLSGVAIRCLKGRERYRRLVVVRFAVYTVAREQGYSYAQIGKIVGKELSTVKYGCKQYGRFTTKVDGFAGLVAALRSMVAEAAANSFPRLAEIKPPPIVEADAEEVMVWCAQCDARVHRASALACAKPFCPQ